MNLRNQGDNNLQQFIPGHGHFEGENRARTNRESERAQWRSETPMESFENDAFHQPPPYSHYQEDEEIKSMLRQILAVQRGQSEETGYEWNYQDHYEPSNEEMNYGWNHEYQCEPSNEEMEYERSDECQYYPSNEEMSYMEEYGYQDEPFDPNFYYHNSGVENRQECEDPEIVSMIQRVMEGKREGDKALKELKNNVERVIKEITESMNRIALHLNSINVESEVVEVSDDEDMTPEGEVMDVFPTDYEIVVECQDDPIFTQQQSPAGEEVEEIIQLHEDTLNEDALASMVAVMNEKTLRYNKASAQETNKEEEKVVQLFDLPKKELHRDEVVEQGVPGSPTPRLNHLQGHA